MSDSSRPLTRRELLAHLAGVPLAGLVGCGATGGWGFGGELLGPNFLLGHRLRDRWQPPPPRDPAERRGVVIVGGGMAGLSAAWQLQRQGIDDFVVLELGDQPGGTSMSGREGGFQFPWGAHYVPTPMKDNETLVELFREMEVIIGSDAEGDPIVAEQFLCREPEERVFFQGRWTEGLYPYLDATENDLDESRRFRQAMQDWAARRDRRGRRLFAIPMSSGADGDEVRSLDRISMADWMSAQGYSSARLLGLVDYACRDDYGLTLGQTSAWAGIFYFASRLRGDGSDSQAVITWPEGNGHIVRYLSQCAGDRLRLNQAVTRIQSEGDGRVLVRAFDSLAGTTTDLVAKDVVFAAPQFMAPHLIADWNSSGRSIDSFRYGGWVVANLFLTERPTESGGAMHWDNVIFESRSLGYVTSTHQTGRDHGATVVTWYHPMLEDDPRVSRESLLRLSWDEWVSVILSDLSRPHPDIAGLISKIDVMRWGHAMIQPRVGFVWGGQRESAAESLGRIHFAATDLSGVALMEEAFDRGVAAARRCIT